MNEKESHGRPYTVTGLTVNADNKHFSHLTGPTLSAEDKTG